MYSDCKYMLSLGIQKVIRLRCYLGDELLLKMQQRRNDADVQITDVAYPIWAELKELEKKRYENVG